MEVVFVGLVVVARGSLVVAIICLTVLAVRKDGLQGRAVKPSLACSERRPAAPRPMTVRA